MGAFLVIIIGVLLALWATLTPNTAEEGRTAFTYNRPSVQSVVGNMIAFHRTAIDFVSQTSNRNPVSTTWTWTYSSQVNVRCPTYTGGLYPTNSVGGSCSLVTGVTEFVPPTYLSNIYNWNVYYYSNGAGGNDDIVVTYVASSSDSVAGYTSDDVSTALADYGLTSETNWYWGVTTDPAPAGVPYTLSNGTTTLNLPTGFTALGVAAIATIIP